MATGTIGPTGIIVQLTHKEACEMIAAAYVSYETLLSYVYSKLKSIILNADKKRKINRLCKGVYTYREEIRAINENSGYKGITIYAGADGTYKGCTPRGIGRSPCRGIRVPVTPSIPEHGHEGVSGPG